MIQDEEYHPPERKMPRSYYDDYDYDSDATITDEQVKRVLVPVIGMIEEGRFDRPRRHLWLRPVIQLAAVAAVVGVVSLTSMRNGTLPDNYIDIIDDTPPLAGSIPQTSMLSGCVMIDGAGVSGVTLTLISTESMEIAATAITVEDGLFNFPNAPAGTFFLTISAQPGTVEADRSQTEVWITTDGDTEPVRAEDGDVLSIPRP